MNLHVDTVISIMMETRRKRQPNHDEHSFNRRKRLANCLNLVQCITCKKMFQGREELLHHLLDNTDIVVCNHCSKKFCNVKEYEKH